MTVKSKSIFKSLTFWGIVLSYCNTIIPHMKIGTMQGFDADFGVAILEATIVFSMSVIGRYNANTIIHTPKNMPGRNKYK